MRAAGRSRAPSSQKVTQRRCSQQYLSFIGLKGKSQQICKADNGKERSPDVDWDSAWASFQRQLRSQVDVTVDTRPPLSATPTRSLTPMEERIRREEIAYAGVWTSQAFYGVAAISTFIVLLLLIANAPEA